MSTCFKISFNTFKYFTHLAFFIKPDIHILSQFHEENYENYSQTCINGNLFITITCPNIQALGLTIKIFFMSLRISAT